MGFWDELSGYTIQPRRNAPLVAILSGGGANGKTALATTLTKQMGPSLVQSQRIDEFSSSRFGMGSLCGKLLYLDDDVRAGAKLNDGILKTISAVHDFGGCGLGQHGKAPQTSIIPGIRGKNCGLAKL